MRSQRDAQKFKFLGESMSDSRETSIVFVNFVSFVITLVFAGSARSALNVVSSIAA